MAPWLPCMQVGLQCTLSPSVDISAIDAWDRTSSWRDSIDPPDPIVMAVIDTGVNHQHRDLRNVMWRNEEEMGGREGVDDDRNGYRDDKHGYDFFGRDGDPMDENGHGTHVAGILAASPGNGMGVAGVALEDTVRVMALRILDDQGKGDVSRVLPAIRYARQNGASVITNSWGGVPGIPSRVIRETLRRAVDDSNDVIIVFAAGNDGNDITANAYYPASLKRPWTVTVAGSDTSGRLARWSNYGSDNVELAAPGQNITSTWLDNSYKMVSGTSMAAPMVSGALSLALTRRPSLHSNALRQLVVASVEPDSRFADSTMYSGRLNANTVTELADEYFMYLPRNGQRIDLDDRSFERSGDGPWWLDSGRTVHRGTAKFLIDATGMAPGTYRGAIVARQTAVPGGGEVRVPVTLTVEGSDEERETAGEKFGMDAASASSTGVNWEAMGNRWSRPAASSVSSSSSSRFTPPLPSPSTSGSTFSRWSELLG
uniref:subtilisin n=1 Tax=Chromera velia CCMP2878 TaxID=1169474 RepID=A0A0G4HX11_9ALVE|eukprot:Cvel_32937.t1-p1 / transcript=Cvel_32937.t1 / gene=Cvel_32937 / organism=Chromera_velia_CCMP2878 / gene_product=Thermophilic serine proteinase, putative / transcript_product=Thermophilic serine proteinase, putative / location=Cvel_scaffold5225:976-2886(+) / protein_length=484 / sequence_SO=supercontig / SO=protein_coding / is_pseudo=false